MKFSFVYTRNKKKKENKKAIKNTKLHMLIPKKGRESFTAVFFPIL